jgi:hypothetical protein
MVANKELVHAIRNNRESVYLVQNLSLYSSNPTALWKAALISRISITIVFMMIKKIFSSLQVAAL